MLPLQTGKGVNIWDVRTQQGGLVANNDTGNVACDSYNKYEEDVSLMKAMNVSDTSIAISLYVIILNTCTYLL